MLVSPSEEQQEIVSYFRQGYNIKIQAIAGSGKSTTLLFLALEAKNTFNATSLILTYNRDLKDAVKSRIASLGLDTHCQAYTYHGYASLIYRQNIYDDITLRKCLKQSPSITSHEIILIDEAQDMNADYYELVSKILYHGNMVVVVGDMRQCINTYLGASSEYLMNYSTYFNTDRPWKELKLRTSYRLTPSNADFINKNVLCEDVIIAGNIRDHDVKPMFSYGVWDIETLVKTNVELYGTGEVVIMMPSVRNINPKSPVGKLCAKKCSNLLFCVREDNLSSETMQNKILITSFHSTKGREWKCTILIGFDESYFEYYAKDWKDAKTLPNILYVAATRAREQLIIIQDDRHVRLRTITLENLYSTCNVRGGMNEKKLVKNDSNKPKIFTVTDLTRHRSTTDTISLLELVQIDNVESPGVILSYQSIVQFSIYYEDLRTYYGVLIPLLVQYHKTGKIDWIPFYESTDLVNSYNVLLLQKDKDIKEWMRLVVLYNAIISNCHFYYHQILDYDWVDVNFVNAGVSRLLAKLSDDGIGTFEYFSTIERLGSTLQGYFDYLAKDGIWEFKCSMTLTDEYKLQCGAYIAMHYENTGQLLPGYLYNIRTNEVMQIVVRDSHKYLELFMRHKLTGGSVESVEVLVPMISGLKLS